MSVNVGDLSDFLVNIYGNSIEFKLVTHQSRSYSHYFNLRYITVRPILSEVMFIGKGMMLEGSQLVLGPGWQISGIP